MIFINPWTWHIYNDEMPTIDFSTKLRRNEWFIVLSYVLISALYIVGVCYLPMYFKHKYDSINAFGITLIALTILYVVLMIACVMLSFKLNFNNKKQKENGR